METNKEKSAYELNRELREKKTAFKIQTNMGFCAIEVDA
jgi:hypothetical protein